MTETIQQATRPPNPEIVQAAAWKAGMLGAFNALALVLAGRFLVLVAIGGEIFLTYMSIGNPDLYRLIALGIYCIFVVCPCVYMAIMGR